MNGLPQFLAQNWALVTVFAAVALVYWLAQSSGSETEPPYVKRGSLATEIELKFYKHLQAAVGGSWTIFSMVHLVEIIQARPGTRNAQAWRNKTLDKRIDFVLCNHDSLEILLAIALDDASPESPEREQFIDSALASAGVPLLRVPVAEQYDKIVLRKQIDDLLAGRK